MSIFCFFFPPFSYINFIFFLFFSFIYLFYFTILYWFCHTLTWICHGCTCVPLPPPVSSKQYTIESQYFFFPKFDNVCLLHGIFSLLTFNVVVTIAEFKLTILSFSPICSIYSFIFIFNFKILILTCVPPTFLSSFGLTEYFYSILFIFFFSSIFCVYFSCWFRYYNIHL